MYKYFYNNMFSFKTSVKKGFLNIHRRIPHSLHPDAGLRGCAALLHGAHPRSIQPTRTHQRLENMSTIQG